MSKGRWESTIHGERFEGYASSDADADEATDVHAADSSSTGSDSTAKAHSASGAEADERAENTDGEGVRGTSDEGCKNNMRAKLYAQPSSLRGGKNLLGASQESAATTVPIPARPAPVARGKKKLCGAYEAKKCPCEPGSCIEPARGDAAAENVDVHTKARATRAVKARAGDPLVYIARALGASMANSSQRDLSCQLDDVIDV